MAKSSLSVVMPALNEEKNIENAVRSSFDAIRAAGIDGEVIVVNDGSSDGTKPVVERLQKTEPRLKLMNHERSLGIGRSFLDGVRASVKDVVVMFPGDNENNPHDALSFLSLMDHVDIIVPFIHNSEIRDHKRRIISSLYRFIINVSFGINLNYTNGTVFYRRCILEGVELLSPGFFYQAEFLIKLIRKGYMFAEVPNLLAVRTSGASKATTLKSLINVMKNYVKLVFNIHILRIESKRDYRNLNPGSVSYKKYAVMDAQPS